MKEKLLKLRNVLISHSKILFPVLLIVVVAVTVLIALSAKEQKENLQDQAVESSEVESSSQEIGTTDSLAQTESIEESGVPNEPLEKDAYPDVNTLIYTYYDSLAHGDSDSIASITRGLDEIGKIKIQELGKYIEKYPVVEIYTKPGPQKDSYVVFAYTKTKFDGFEEEVAGFQTFYVCTDENGTVYLNEDEIPQDEIDYIYEINYQEDVVELYNKTTVEYNETMLANKELFEYLATMESDIRAATGMLIANQTTSGGDGSQSQDGDGENQPQGGETQEPEVTGPVYAVAVATVNVRKSDSTQADKLGKVSKGDRIRVLEQKANGWSKVEYDGEQGYIKSEYLQVEESLSELKVIGTVTATATINVRASASTNGTKLGAITSGESLKLIEVKDGWCKVLYEDQVAYVSAEYVKQN